MTNIETVKQEKGGIKLGISKPYGPSQRRAPTKATRQPVTPARFLAFIAVAVIVLSILSHLH